MSCVGLHLSLYAAATAATAVLTPLAVAGAPAEVLVGEGEGAARPLPAQLLMAFVRLLHMEVWK